MILERRKQAVSDLKPGDRRAGERQRRLCRAAGVAHSLFPTLSPPLISPHDTRSCGQVHTETSDRRGDRWGVRSMEPVRSRERSPDKRRRRSTECH